MNKILLLFLLALGLPLSLHADADADWKKIEVLDKGPQQKPTTPEEAQRIAKLHLSTELNATRAFVKNYPDDPRVFDAKFRQAAIIAAIGKIDHNQTMVNDSLRLYTELENTPNLPPDKQANVAFCHVSLYIQNVDLATSQGRESILATVQNFKARYPDDKRTPRLLVEAATLFDNLPDQKREMLLAARPLSKDEELNLRIADDLRRLDLLGKPIDLTLHTIQGQKISMESLRGKIVMLLFWAADSPHCQIWLRTFRQESSKFPPNVTILTVSLDTSRENLDQIMSHFGISWPTQFDGKGWESPLARQLGINALPTLWILDRHGRLRTLNARDSYTNWIHTLAQEN